MQRRVSVFLTIACIGLMTLLVLIGKRPAKSRSGQLTALTQTYIPIEAGKPISVPRLITAAGRVLAPEQLQGHWSVIFFGFTACPLVCPRTLAVLTAMARNPESDVSSGTTQPVFVSVDAETIPPATPCRLSPMRPGKTKQAKLYAKACKAPGCRPTNFLN
jgi:cytochrome oxidase Cu insertion factor (SCO1/SenC/PrrC family)